MADESTQNKNPIFALQRIYLKDASFESPNAPKVFQGDWKPQINMDLNTENKRVSDNQWEITLTITLTARIDGEAAFIVEIQQAGVFMIEGLDAPKLAHTLGAFCPNILFPYARETIDTLVVKGSFPAMMLQPVNFDAIFADAMKKRQAEAEGKAGGEPRH